MAFPGMTAPKLDDLPIGIRPRLAALWTGLLFCFIYADILGLYDPWLIGEILKGNMGPVGPITQELKFAVAVLMSIPAIMVFLSVVLERRPNRWANIIAAVLFAVATCITLSMDPWAYYIYFAVLELGFICLIVWHAWAWPLAGTAQAYCRRGIGKEVSE